MIPSISATEASARVASGTAVLVDVREAFEYARERVPGAVSMPLSRFNPAALGLQLRDRGAPAVIFYCESGRRTAESAAQLVCCGVADSYVLAGGISAWKEHGFRTMIDRTRPIELQRQAQIAAGFLVLIGVTLALTYSPWLMVIPALVGSGLVFAGVSGWCGMAKLLAAMPWNSTSR